MHPTIYYYRRTGNRGQTCLPVGLNVIDNSPLPARYQITLRFNGRVRGSLKPSPRLVQASISSLHHRWTVKPRPGLLSVEDCCKQSDTEQFKLSVGYNSYKNVRRVRNHVHILHSDCVVVCQRIKPYCAQPNGFTCQPLRGLVHASVARGIINDS